MSLAALANPSLSNSSKSIRFAVTKFKGSERRLTFNGKIDYGGG